MVHRFAQAAINRRSGKETHRRIDVIHAQFAGTRTHIRNAGLHGHTIAHLEAFDARTDLNHRAGSLMTENHRLLHHIFTHATMRVIMQVGTAHTNGMRRDLQLAQTKCGGVRYLTHIDDALLFENDCLHDYSPLWIMVFFEKNDDD